MFATHIVAAPEPAARVMELTAAAPDLEQLTFMYVLAVEEACIVNVLELVAIVF
jgi:hypothetical protein